MTENTVAATQVDLYYATDPLCSFCWAFEPTLRKFRYQYGKYLAQDTIVMGGMIEKWATFGGDAGNGITKASDVAHHWQEIGRHTRMPIDGSIWSDTPIESSFPSSQVFEIVRRDHPESANLFLRKLRETVMLWNQNIAEEAVLREYIGGNGSGQPENMGCSRFCGRTRIAERGSAIDESAAGYRVSDARFRECPEPRNKSRRSPAV